MKRNGWMVLAGLVVCAGSVYAQQPTKITLGHGAAPGNPRHDAAVLFAERVKEKTAGRYEVFVAHSAMLGDDAAMITALRSGSLDMSANSQGAISAAVPEYAALGLPFLFPAIEKAWTLLDGPVGKELAEKSAAKGMVVLGYWDNGIRQITNSKRPIAKPEDLRGLRIRTTTDKSIMDTMTALGATPVPMNFSTVYEALKQKFVDGQDNPLANIHSAKLHEVQQYISITNHNYSVAPFVMSRQTWEKLSSDQRAWIKAAAQEATAAQRKAMADSDVLLLAEYEKMPSVKVNKADQAAFKAAVQKVWDAWELKPFGAFVKKLRAASN